MTHRLDALVAALLSTVLTVSCAASHSPVDRVARPGSVTGFETGAHAYLFVPAEDACARIVVALGPTRTTERDGLRAESDGDLSLSWFESECSAVRAGSEEGRPLAPEPDRAARGWIRFVSGEISGELAVSEPDLDEPSVRLTIEHQRVTLL